MLAYRLTDRQAGAGLTDLPRPSPGPGEALVRIAACGLNFADLLMIEGKYQDTPALPFTLGMEAAGVVESLGPGTAGPAPGTRVACRRSRATTSAAVSVRSPSGFSITNIVPERREPPPIEAVTLSTAGSLRTISTNCSILRRVSSNGAD